MKSPVIHFLLNNILGLFFTISLLTLSSCVSEKKAVYFNNAQDTTFAAAISEMPAVIQKNDLLSITVSSLNPEASIIFNTPNLPSVSTSTSAGTNAPLTGYLVNGDGNIEFPVLGRLHVAGLTKNQLTEELVDSLVNKKLLFGPIITIRFLNFRVTVLGEVNRPTVVSVANERISILEAIGLAGDLTIFAKRENVLLIREENGIKTLKRINLNSSEIFTSPYYYLKTNDIIYAEPNNTRLASASTTRQILPLVLSGLSFIAIILTRVL